MQIDWFTLLAQMVNFGILVFLLHRFLYGPIVRAMEERQQNIAARLEEAARERAEAQEEAAKYRRQQQELRKQRERIAARAEQEVEKEREELLKEMRAEAEQIEERWRHAIEREQDQFLHELQHRASQQVVDMVRRALSDLADADLERQMIDVFMRMVLEMDEQQRKGMSDCIERSRGEVVIRSTFRIPEEHRSQLIELVADELFSGGHIQTRFERSDDVVCGLEIRAGGRRLAWSIEDYLGDLEEQVRQALDEDVSARAERQRLRA